MFLRCFLYGAVAGVPVTITVAGVAKTFTVETAQQDVDIAMELIAAPAFQDGDIVYYDRVQVVDPIQAAPVAESVPVAPAADSVPPAL